MDKNSLNAFIISAVTAAVISSLVFFLGARFGRLVPYYSPNKASVMSERKQDGKDDERNDGN